MIHLLQNEIMIEMHDCRCEWIHLLQNEILIEMHDCSCEWIHLITERDSDRNARL